MSKNWNALIRVGNNPETINYINGILKETQFVKLKTFTIITQILKVHK